MKVAHLLALLLLTSPLCVRADPTTDKVDAEKQIRAALAKWTEAANRQDWKTALDVWAPDLIGQAPDGADDTYAREAAFAAHPLPSHTTYVLRVDEVIVDGSLAIVRDTWTETTKLKSGGSKSDTFRSYEVWRRQPDRSWKISRWIDTPGVAPSKP